MACAAVDSLGERVSAGLAVGFRPRRNRLLPIEWIDGAHPVPDERSIRAATRALAIADEARTADEELLVLLSGGASAMLAAPADGISLEDKRRTTDVLLRAGVDIRQVNCIRKHLSAIKGGRLAIAARRCRTLAISDVNDPPDDPATIGSGPTAADDTTYAEALRVLDERALIVPRAVRLHLERGAAGELDETPKAGDERLQASSFQVIANRRTAMDAAAREAERRGYVVGSGRGGRNQEFVLGAAPALAQASRPIVIGSAGTDGIDGPTDAAGGVATPTTLSRLHALGFDVGDVLARNDAYTALARSGDLITWGPTLTNVGDVHVVLTMSP
jgi:glycerate-2-kinase